jgi:hypothetical protein
LHDQRRDQHRRPIGWEEPGNTLDGEVGDAHGVFQRATDHETGDAEEQEDAIASGIEPHADAAALGKEVGIDRGVVEQHHADRRDPAQGVEFLQPVSERAADRLLFKPIRTHVDLLFFNEGHDGPP